MFRWENSRNDVSCKCLKVFRIEWPNNFQIPQWYELIRTGVCTNWSSEKKQQKESKNGKKKKSNVKTEEEWLQNAFMCKNIWKKIVVG